MMENKMCEIKVEKVVLNIGTSPDPANVEKAVKLLKIISKVKPVKTYATKRIAGWGIRPGLALGAKVTLRGKAAEALLKRLLDAIEFKIREKSFTENGFSFGLKEYIDIEDVDYEPTIGMLGLDVCVCLKRPGFRIKQRGLKKGKLGKRQRISSKDVKLYAVDKFKVVVE